MLDADRLRVIFALTVFILPYRLSIYWQLVVKMMIFWQHWCDLLEDLKVAKAEERFGGYLWIRPSA